MKKIISVLTATRAEYGLLKPVVAKLLEYEEFDVRIVATGMHLSAKYGFTYKEVEEDGFAIDEKIDILEDSNTEAAISKSMGTALIKFSNYFEKLKPDMLMVLGDRYETLAVCCAAMNARIPIAHLYGGETTEGAIDEAIRHAITKMSYLHFTSTLEYRKRVIQLGESPDRVYQVGALGIENILKTNLLSKEELERSIQFKLDKPYGVVTFHPVTLEDNTVKEQFYNLLCAMDKHDELKYIITKANADASGVMINEIIDQYAAVHDNVIAYPSLGMLRYLSALKYCSMVIGNSSSGIIEAPSFGIPTVNIGDRQKGRIQSDSIINCRAECDSINEAIKAALNEEFIKKAKRTVNPYGDGHASDRIVNVIKEYLLENRINLKKKFYDITFMC
ncbi:UDP-N-acetylglucosamine 2-epimerase [Anaerocolumna aminovalerica]|uniref:UDP-N-acetylglucosamine 2-epimerase n=1 Tax=Anaerocolumna aminovalerica TaxID=1527 RepID=UPI00248D353E|nr:UDP-N-acetylglucosamine 2-epimerase [Anaerocolumna aminovalerica]